jgi:DNA (cytosine-5)-methyltransferase 1
VLALTLPFSTVTCVDHHALVGVELGRMTERVRAFLVQYNGQSVGQSVQLPLGTVTTRDRFGLVKVAGEDYEIADIGMRMLKARELFRAQGFADHYVIDPVVNGKPLSHGAQIRMCGNSCSPYPVAAMVRANLSTREATRAA